MVSVTTTTYQCETPKGQRSDLRSDLRSQLRSDFSLCHQKNKHKPIVSHGLSIIILFIVIATLYRVMLNQKN